MNRNQLSIRIASNVKDSKNVHTCHHIIAILENFRSKCCWCLWHFKTQLKVVVWYGYEPSIQSRNIVMRHTWFKLHREGKKTQYRIKCFPFLNAMHGESRAFYGRRRIMRDLKLWPISIAAHLMRCSLSIFVCSNWNWVYLICRSVSCGCCIRNFSLWWHLTIFLMLQQISHSADFIGRKYAIRMNQKHFSNAHNRHQCVCICISSLCVCVCLLTNLFHRLMKTANNGHVFYHKNAWIFVFFFSFLMKYSFYCYYSGQPLHLHRCGLTAFYW